MLSIRNKYFLVVLDKLITSSSSEPDIIELTKEQKKSGMAQCHVIWPCTSDSSL